MATYKGEDIDLRPTQAMAEEARRGLDWRKEHGRGGTAVGVARARQIVNRQELSPRTVRRMVSFFARHEVDKEAEGFSPGEDGYPSAGRIAWALWGGDAGQTWSRGRDAIMDRIDNEDTRALEDEFSEATLKALQKKVDDHNAEHGDKKGKRVTLSMLAAVYKRGIGAYNTNPGSVRPTVTSAEQWAMARVNVFLQAVRTGKYKSGKFDTDLLPDGHPLKTEEERGEYDARPYPNEHAARITDPDQYDEFARDVEAGGDGIDFIYGINDNGSEIQSIRFDSDRYSEAEAREWLRENDFDPIKFEPAIEGRKMEERHIVDVAETDETVTIVFAKHSDEEVMPEEMDERPYHDDDEDERFDRSDLVMRAMDMDDKAIDVDARTVRVGVSSEEPVKRAFGMEVIDHSRESMNLDFLNSGRAPLLLNHDMDTQIGIVESVELDEEARRLRAIVRFGKGDRASEVFNDVSDGIRQNISVGYRVDGRVESEDDGEDIVRVATTPMEISIVSIPADQSSLVGVGRSISEPLNATIRTEEKQMSDIDLDAVRQEAAKAAQKNAKEIMTLARKHSRADLGEDAIGRGVSVDEFRGELLEVIANKPLETPAHVVDAPIKDQREYSLARMIRAQATNDWSDAGFEREMSEEVQRRTGRAARGVYVPDFAWRAGAMATAATGAVGDENVVDNFIPTVHRGDMFIEALRSKQVMANLGVTFMGGLTNRIKMPKFSAGATAAFVEELGAVADQSQTDAGVTLQPRTMGAFVDISRLALKESVPALDQIVQDDLLRAAADLIESAAISGSGSSGQPTGILNNGDVGNVDISAGTDVAALTWADLTDLVKTVEDADGVINAQTLGWLSNPKVKAKMANTVKVASTDSIMLLNDPWNSIYGYRAEFTSNVPSNLNPGDGGTDASALIYGDFSQLIVGLFGGADIMIDETTGGLAGTTRIILHQDVDVAIRNGASFAITDEVSTA
jgi:HK97 family phage major capsid protein/HK97 family phage prohead protease